MSYLFILILPILQETPASIPDLPLLYFIHSTTLQGRLNGKRATGSEFHGLLEV